MSREIKFKAWDTVELKMILWPKLQKKCLFQFKDSDGLIWLQFTGLFDKNGVEIYEGDICNVNQMVDTVWLTERGVMKFNKKAAQFAISISNSWLAEDKDISNVEVIGNIYSDPHLIEGESK